ncbi:hypothetical protein Adt_10630 [Abeliophyllum distichum]|uniref:Uncharacterized protein n=1 Tax=Abeliophyllum distichum TaxID=126358 RepID=A0ABD1UKU4_9LAMI
MALPSTKPSDPLPPFLPVNTTFDGGNTSPTTSTTAIGHISTDLEQNKSVLHWESQCTQFDILLSEFGHGTITNDLRSPKNPKDGAYNVQFGWNQYLGKRTVDFNS